MFRTPSAGLAELAGRRSDQECRVSEDITHREVSQANNTSLNDGQCDRLVTPTHHVGDGAALMSPDDGLDQLLPVTTPGDEEHETGSPHQVTEEEHPSPNSKVVAAEGVVAIDQLGGVEPQVVTEPTHQIGAGLVELGNVALPDGEVLPVPVEGDPTHCVQCPEDSQIEGVPSRDVTGAATAGAIAGEGVTEVLLVGHQLGATGIQCTLHEDQGGGVETQCNGVVNQEVTRADRQEQIVAATNTIDGIHPVMLSRNVLRRKGCRTGGVSQEDVKAIDRLTRSGLDELCEDRLNEDLLLGSTEGHDHIVVDVETQGVEAKEQSDPAQVADDSFFVLEHPAKDVVLIGFGVVVTDEEDRTVSEGTAHQEDGDVLVVGVKGSLRCVGLRDEGVRRHGVHVLSNKGGDHAEGGESQTKLHVQAVVQGVVQTTVTCTEVSRSALRRIVGFEDLLDGVTDAEIRPIHVTGDHKDATDGQMVVSNVCQPESFRLRMEATQEGEDGGARAFGCAKNLSCGVRVLGINTPVAGKERSQTGGVRHHAEEVVPTNVLTTGLRNRNVNKVTSPGD